MSNWQQVWEFSTARFRIVGEVTDCDIDPRDHFEFAEDIEAIESGRVAWFDARVRVLLDGNEVGADYLGCCAYHNPDELFRHHASYQRELRALRRQHATKLDSAKRHRGTALGAYELRRAGKLRREIAEVAKILRNNGSLNPRVTYCEYGPGMVTEAIARARYTLARHATVRLRVPAPDGAIMLRDA